MSERLTDEERSDWEQYRKYLLMIWRRSETVVDTKRLCALIESEKTGWAEADKWRTEAFKQHPTQDAYDHACKALWIHRGNSEMLRSEVGKLEELLLDAYNALLELDKWYNDGVCTWEPHCPAELAAIWRRAASVRQRIQGHGDEGEREQKLKDLLHRILKYTSNSQAYTNAAYIHFWTRSTLKSVYGEEEI